MNLQLIPIATEIRKQLLSGENHPAQNEAGFAGKDS